VRDSRLVAQGPGLSVLVADADTSFADRIADLFSEREGGACVTRASTMGEAVDVLLLEPPDLAFVAADLRDASAIMAYIHDVTPGLPCVVLRNEAAGSPTSDVAAPGNMCPAVRISAYLAKSEDAPEIIGVVAALSMVSGLC
jgi:ActR/RegA family two-component response regulator